METFVLIITVPILIYTGITLMGSFQILMLQKINIQVINKENQRKKLAKACTNTNNWAQANGFDFLNFYESKIGGTLISMAVWQRPDRPTFMVEYFARSGSQLARVIDFATEFADGIDLTTANSSDAQLFPKPPGIYNQTFSKIDLDDQWGLHIEMENYLMDEGQAMLVNIDKNFEQALVESVKKEAAFVRTIKYWPFRMAWWYFIRKNTRHNLTIRSLHDKGLIKLPCELSPEMSL